MEVEAHCCRKNNLREYEIEYLRIYLFTIKFINANLESGTIIQNRFNPWEGSYWHQGYQEILNIVIEGKKVGCIDPLTKIFEEKEVGKRIGIFVSAKNRKLIIKLQSSIEELDFKAAQKRELIKIENDVLQNLYNDDKCDAAGRLWISIMSMEMKIYEGSLYCFESNSRKKVGHVNVASSLCWSKYNIKMIYIDSSYYNIKAYDFALTSGNSSERIIINQKPFETPDSVCIDEKGMLLAAMWGVARIYRYTSFDRTLIDITNTNTLNVISCNLGGKNIDQLSINTRRVGLNDKQLQQYPLSGSLFIAEPKIIGSLQLIFHSPGL